MVLLPGCSDTLIPVIGPAKTTAEMASRMRICLSSPSCAISSALSRSSLAFALLRAAMSAIASAFAADGSIETAAMPPANSAARRVLAAAGMAPDRTAPESGCAGSKAAEEKARASILSENRELFVDEACRGHPGGQKRSGTCGATPGGSLQYLHTAAKLCATPCFSSLARWARRQKFALVVCAIWLPTKGVSERPDVARGGFGESGGLRGIGIATPETGKCVSARSS